LAKSLIWLIATFGVTHEKIAGTKKKPNTETKVVKSRISKLLAGVWIIFSMVFVMRFTAGTLTYPKISSVQRFFSGCEISPKRGKLLLLFKRIFCHNILISSGKNPKKPIKKLNFLGRKLEADFSLVTF
jgi:hypothetical protein